MTEVRAANRRRLGWTSVLALLGAAGLVAAWFLGHPRWSPPLALASLAVCCTAYARVERQAGTRTSRRAGLVYAGLGLALWIGAVVLLLFR